MKTDRIPKLPTGRHFLELSEMCLYIQDLWIMERLLTIGPILDVKVLDMAVQDLKLYLKGYPIKITHMTSIKLFFFPKFTQIS